MSQTNLEHKTILVTGAGGYLGSALVGYLCELGHHVIALYRSSLPGAHPKAFPVCIDLEQENLLASPLRGVDLVIHAAWDNSFLGPKNVEDSSLQNSANLQALEKLLRAVERAKTKKFLFLSAQGASYKNKNTFLQEKYLAESLVINADIPSKVIARQSIVVGRGKKVDNFVSSILNCMRVPFFYPKPPKQTTFYPLYLEDWLRTLTAQVVESSNKKIRLMNFSGPQDYSADKVFSLISNHCFIGGRFALPRFFSKIFFTFFEKKKSEHTLSFTSFQSFAESTTEQEEGWQKVFLADKQTRSFEDVLKLEYLPKS